MDAMSKDLAKRDIGPFLLELFSNLNWSQASDRELWANAVYPTLEKSIRTLSWREEHLVMVVDHCAPIIHPRTHSDMSALLSKNLVSAVQRISAAAHAAALSRF